MIKNERINEVGKLVEEALDGDLLAQAKIKSEILGVIEAEESHSTSDFPAALKANVGRSFQATYAQIPSTYKEWTVDYKVNNLRPESFYSLATDLSNLPDSNGGYDTIKDAPGGLARIPELTEYPTISFTASESSLSVAKYGARVNFSFEMLLNDEWGALETLPRQLAQLARNQEDIVATELLVDANGPDQRFFNATNANRLTVADGFSSNNPALSIQSLEDAIAWIRGKQLNGNPVIVNDFTLQVPPALAGEARRILGITSLEVTDGSGTYMVANPVSAVKLVVNPWLAVINKSADANTTWFVHPTGGSNGIRPTFVFAGLRGREIPELRIANATGSYLGGGAVPGREGSFLNDDIEFRVRHFVGAAGIAFETAAVSTGTTNA